jgi:hypothetical protein
MKQKRFFEWLYIQKNDPRKVQKMNATLFEIVSRKILKKLKSEKNGQKLLFLYQMTSSDTTASAATAGAASAGDCCVSVGAGATVPKTDGTEGLTLTDCAFSA